MKFLKLNIGDGRAAAVRIDKIAYMEHDGREVRISVNGISDEDIVETYGTEKEAGRRYEAILRLLAEV